MHRRWAIAIAALVAAACPGGDTPMGAGSLGGSDDSDSDGGATAPASTGDVGDSTTAAVESTAADDTTAGLVDDTGAPAASSSDGADDGTSTGPATTDTGAAGSSEDSAGGTDTGPPCPAGERGCPCISGVCQRGLFCIDEVCSAPMRCPPDRNEANDSEDEATDLGDIEDCDGDGSMVSGVLDGALDEDWFTYHGDDVGGCQVDPTRGLSAEAGLRLCKFMECDDGIGVTEVDCPTGTAQATSPDGRPGCCGDEGFEFDGTNCTGTIDDDATIYMRVDQAEDECVAYTLSYHF